MMVTITASVSMSDGSALVRAVLSSMVNDILWLVESDCNDFEWRERRCDDFVAQRSCRRTMVMMQNSL